MVGWLVFIGVFGRFEVGVGSMVGVQMVGVMRSIDSHRVGDMSNANDIRLSDLDQWVAWKYGNRVSATTGKPEKIPINPHTGRPANKTTAAHWGTLVQARARARRDGLNGVGVCLTTADPFLCIDLDDAIINGRPSPMAVELMGRFESYAEYSPSGDGLHIWIKSDEQINMNRKATAGVEIYAYANYLTWTGRRLEGAPNKINHADLGWLIERIGGQGEDREQAATTKPCGYQSTPTTDDAKLWALIWRVDQTGRAERLYRGDLSPVGGDHSGGVVVLLNTLAKFTNGDRARMRRMMEQTGLRNDKWSSRRGEGDWLKWRIENACRYQGHR